LTTNFSYFSAVTTPEEANETRILSKELDSAWRNSQVLYKEALLSSDAERRILRSDIRQYAHSEYLSHCSLN
jgi:hypothetical protein